MFPANRIVRFDGSNFLPWKNRVYTELQCELLTSYVEKQPTADDRKLDTWIQGNAKARKIIVENLADSLLHYAPTTCCAFEIWRRLNTTFQRCSYLQHAYLRRKLSNLRFDGKGDLNSFFREYDDLVAEIRSSNGKIEDLEAVVILLSMMPSEFAPVICSYGEVKKEVLSLETVKGSLLDFDLKRKDEGKSGSSNSTSESAAFFSNSDHRNRNHTEKKSTNDEKVDKFCDFCKKSGHSENYCFRKKKQLREKQSSSNSRSGEANIVADNRELHRDSTRTVLFSVETDLIEENASAIESNNLVLDVEIRFVTDSGCTRFMVNDQSYFSSLSKLDKPNPIYLADDRVVHATHAGTVNLISNLGNDVVFSNVLFVPELRRNLISVRRVTLQDYEVVFKRNSVEIRSENGDILASGTVTNDLYFMTFHVKPVEANITESVSYSLIHRRFGHLNKKSLLKLKSENVINFSGEIPNLCDSCVRGKQSQMPYESSNSSCSRPLELIVSDVCFVEQKCYLGYKYFVTFLDVFTHFSMVYLLKSKDEVFEKFCEYEALVTAHFNSKIVSFLSDNGTEYVNSDFKDFCRKKGIRLLNTVPYNHQMNGKAERLNRTLEDKARTLLIDSGLEKRFWCEAVLCATYLLNRSPTSATEKIPAEIWYNKPINCSSFRIFGALAYAHIPKEKRKKFDSHSKVGIMVGYAPHGYRLLDIESENIFVARNVTFDENKLYKDIIADVKLHPRSAARAETPAEEPAEVAEMPESIILPQNTTELSNLPRPRRNVRLPEYLNDYEVSIEYCEALFCECSQVESVPRKWHEPMKKELLSLEKHQVWSLVPRLPGMNVLRSKWVLREKPEKLKARLVAIGCSQKDAPTDIFAPVANMTTVKVFLCITVQQNLFLHHMDVSSAFLHGELEEAVYMEQPPGFVTDKSLVCHLHKSIYGLKVSPKLWNKCIDRFLVNSEGFTRSKFDHCLYFKHNNSDSIFVLIYVDDLLIASSSENLISDFKINISKTFDIVDLKEAERFLGMSIEYDRNNNVMTISQKELILKIIKRFNLTDANPIQTPMEKDLHLLPSEENNVNLPYRELLGCLLYISICSRPDISFSVNYLSRFMNSFSDVHFNHLKRIIKYLKQTINLKLTYNKANGDQVISCNVDADWASDSNDRKSISGHVVKLFDNVILWSSKKQLSIALSSTESEYIALSTFIHDVLFWLIQLLNDFNIKISPPITIFEDNQPVINLTNNPINSKRSKHIDVRFRYTKEMIQNGFITLKYISTDHQLGDIFTKSLGKIKFVYFRGLLKVI
ncbi:hypothetical protein V9T40_013064 [Parthenolecanium corni]|uniref:Integrase catalytic domain-containing protein n=1 Tax=Parthenolecanium corni TaxID=536013 RepID=A0AAN9T8B7_9HEMI